MPDYGFLKEGLLTGVNISFSGNPANKLLIVGDGGIVATSGVSTTEINYLVGSTANIQDQINNKPSSANPVFTGFPTISALNFFSTSGQTNTIATSAFGAPLQLTSSAVYNIRALIVGRTPDGTKRAAYDYEYGYQLGGSTGSMIGVTQFLSANETDSSWNTSAITVGTTFQFAGNGGSSSAELVLWDVIAWYTKVTL